MRSMTDILQGMDDSLFEQDTSYAPEGRFNNVYEVLIWFKNLNEYNGLRFIHDKEYINVIIPLTKATVMYNSHNKSQMMGHYNSCS